MIEVNDWRLMNQMAYLHKKQLQFIPYTPYSETWEHDHCAFCSELINKDIGKAYCTLDQYHWICETCFNDFKNMFEWDLLHT